MAPLVNGSSAGNESPELSSDVALLRAETRDVSDRILHELYALNRAEDITGTKERGGARATDLWVTLNTELSAAFFDNGGVALAEALLKLNRMDDAALHHPENRSLAETIIGRTRSTAKKLSAVVHELRYLRPHQSAEAVADDFGGVIGELRRLVHRIGEDADYLLWNFDGAEELPETLPVSDPMDQEMYGERWETMIRISGIQAKKGVGSFKRSVLALSEQKTRIVLSELEDAIAKLQLSSHPERTELIEAYALLFEWLQHQMVYYTEGDGDSLGLYHFDREPAPRMVKLFQSMDLIKHHDPVFFANIIGFDPHSAELYSLEWGNFLHKAMANTEQYLAQPGARAPMLKTLFRQLLEVDSSVPVYTGAYSEAHLRSLVAEVRGKLAEEPPESRASFMAFAAPFLLRFSLEARLAVELALISEVDIESKTNQLLRLIADVKQPMTLLKEIGEAPLAVLRDARVEAKLREIFGPAVDGVRVLKNDCSRETPDVVKAVFDRIPSITIGPATGGVFYGGFIQSALIHADRYQPWVVALVLGLSKLPYRNGGEFLRAALQGRFIPPDFARANRFAHGATPWGGSPNVETMESYDRNKSVLQELITPTDFDEYEDARAQAAKLHPGDRAAFWAYFINHREQAKHYREVHWHGAIWEMGDRADADGFSAGESAEDILVASLVSNPSDNAIVKTGLPYFLDHVPAERRLEVLDLIEKNAAHHSSGALDIVTPLIRTDVLKQLPPEDYRLFLELPHQAAILDRILSGACPYISGAGEDQSYPERYHPEDLLLYAVQHSTPEVVDKMLMNVFPAVSVGPKKLQILEIMRDTPALVPLLWYRLGVVKNNGDEIWRATFFPAFRQHVPAAIPEFLHYTDMVPAGMRLALVRESLAAPGGVDEFFKDPRDVLQDAELGSAPTLAAVAEAAPERVPELLPFFPDFISPEHLGKFVSKYADILRRYFFKNATAFYQAAGNDTAVALLKILVHDRPETVLCFTEQLAAMPLEDPEKASRRGAYIDQMARYLCVTDENANALVDPLDTDELYRLCHASADRVTDLFERQFSALLTKNRKKILNVPLQNRGAWGRAIVSRVPHAFLYACPDEAIPDFMLCFWRDRGLFALALSRMPKDRASALRVFNPADANKVTAADRNALGERLHHFVNSATPSEDRLPILLAAMDFCGRSIDGRVSKVTYQHIHPKDRALILGRTLRSPTVATAFLTDIPAFAEKIGRDAESFDGADETVIAAGKDALYKTAAASHTVQAALRNDTHFTYFPSVAATPYLKDLITDPLIRKLVSCDVDQVFSPSFAERLEACGLLSRIEWARRAEKHRRRLPVAPRAAKKRGRKNKPPLV